MFEPDREMNFSWMPKRKQNWKRERNLKRIEVVESEVEAQTEWILKRILRSLLFPMLKRFSDAALNAEAEASAARLRIGSGCDSR